jgi:hypothetical protein
MLLPDGATLDRVETNARLVRLLLPAKSLTRIGEVTGVTKDLGAVISYRFRPRLAGAAAAGVASFVRPGRSATSCWAARVRGTSAWRERSHALFAFGLLMEGDLFKPEKEWLTWFFSLLEAGLGCLVPRSACSPTGGFQAHSGAGG